MLLGGVCRTEAELVRNLRPRRGHAGFGYEPLDQTQDLGLPGSEVGHLGCLFIYTATVIISRLRAAARPPSNRELSLLPELPHPPYNGMLCRPDAARLELQLVAREPRRD